MTFLETLTDTIGERVTGSPESEAASELILKTLKDARFDNAHFEEYRLAVRWRRGSAKGAVISPVRQPILIQSYGWGPGTNGRKEILLLAATIATNGKPSGDAAKLKGSAVLVDLASSADISTSPNYVVRRSSIARELAGVGATAMLIQSDKPGRMLFPSAAGLYPGAPPPMLSVAKEDALFLRRLLSKGDVRPELDVQNSLDASPSKERNMVAELTGTSPQEIVLLGAHFDSWDTAQGRTTTVPESRPSSKAHVFSNARRQDESRDSLRLFFQVRNRLASVLERIFKVTTIHLIIDGLL